MDVVDLNKFRTKKAHDTAVEASAEMLAELNYYINYMANHINPVILAGAIATQLGRFVNALDPKNETDLLEKCLLTVDLFAQGYGGVKDEQPK